MADDTNKRGLASADEDTRQEVASKGGQASGGNFKNDPEKASEAGKKGGQAQSEQNQSESESESDEDLNMTD